MSRPSEQFVLATARQQREREQQQVKRFAWFLIVALREIVIEIADLFILNDRGHRLIYKKVEESNLFPTVCSVGKTQHRKLP